MKKGKVHDPLQKEINSNSEPKTHIKLAKSLSPQKPIICKKPEEQQKAYNSKKACIHPNLNKKAMGMIHRITLIQLLAKNFIRIQSDA